MTWHKHLQNIHLPNLAHHGNSLKRYHIKMKKTVFFRWNSQIHNFTHLFSPRCFPRSQSDCCRGTRCPERFRKACAADKRDPRHGPGPVRRSIRESKCLGETWWFEAQGIVPGFALKPRNSSQNRLHDSQWHCSSSQSWLAVNRVIGIQFHEELVPMICLLKQTNFAALRVEVKYSYYTRSCVWNHTVHSVFVQVKDPYQLVLT